MKRVIAGLAVAAVAALTAPAASAYVEVDNCGSFTPPMPCGICLYDGPSRECYYW